ncbi:primase-helicase family protein [Psychroflexus salis]|nr:primase-helicase family protein [Psychroflexus salis]
MKKIKFWEKTQGKIKINNMKLINFLELNGFYRCSDKVINEEIVRIDNNLINASSIEEITYFLREHLTAINEEEVLQKLIEGIGSYINKSKLNFLKPVKINSDRDEIYNSRFFFLNGFCEIDKNEIVFKKYAELKFCIWKSRLIKHEFKSDYLKTQEIGQFEKFCKKISGEIEKKFNSFQTILGYLMHRNRRKEAGRCVIFYDAKMRENNLANGGSGKSLIQDAIGKCRQAIQFDGKEIKKGSFFKNQRLDITSDIIIYDDLKKGVNLNDFFSVITGDIEVEKKRKSAFIIPKHLAPKMLISSNHYVNGTGGSSDRRRRWEFELENYFDDKYTPEDEFGNLFFEDHWSSKEWNLFYVFMMKCVSSYLKNGRLEFKDDNLALSILKDKTSHNFPNFAMRNIKIGTIYDKNKLKDKYNKTLESGSEISTSMFHKFLKNYSEYLGNKYKYISTSSGGVNKFSIISKINFLPNYRKFFIKTQANEKI